MGQEQITNNNKALWVFPNFRETINSLPPKMRGRAWEILMEIAFGNENFSKNLQKEKIFVQIAIKSLLPLIRLRGTPGSKNGVSNNPSGRRKEPVESIPNIGANIAPNIAPNIGANSCINNNSNNNNNKQLTSTLFAASVQKPARKRNRLQVFSNCVLTYFEPEIKTNEQKRVWFKRNARCLSDILAFCENSLEGAILTISECIDWLQKNRLDGGYEAVIRNASRFYPIAKQKLQKGFKFQFTEELQKQIKELED